MTGKSISKRYAGRLAGILYLLTSVMMTVILLSPLELDFDRSTVLPMLPMTVMAGLIGLLAPWDRWPQFASVGLALYAYALMAITPVWTKLNPVIGFPFYVLVLVWVGVCQPRFASLLLTPVAAGAMVTAAITYGGPISADLVMIGIATLLVGAVVGESLSFTMIMLAKAEDHEKIRLEKVEMIVDAAEDLASQVSLEGTGSLLSWYAGEIIRAVGVRTVVIDAEFEESVHYDWGTVDESTWQVPDWIWQEISENPWSIQSPADLGWWANCEEVKSVVCVSLHGSGQTFGLVAVGLDIEPVAVPETHGGSTRALATQGGLAFERVRANLVLLDQSLRDELTGVGNRRHAMALLGRVGPSDGVVIVDLDHFKDVNDSFGHDRGDELLKQLSGYLTESLRDGDAVARYGGDEFLVVLWNAGENVVEASERLIDGWRALNPITSLSVGVAVHYHDATAHETFLRSDAALYEAKSRGRDQCVVIMSDQDLPALGLGQKRAAGNISELEELDQLPG